MAAPEFVLRKDTLNDLPLRDADSSVVTGALDTSSIARCLGGQFEHYSLHGSDYTPHFDVLTATPVPEPPPGLENFPRGHEFSENDVEDTLDHVDVLECASCGRLGNNKTNLPCVKCHELTCARCRSLVSCAKCRVKDDFS